MALFIGLCAGVIWGKFAPSPTAMEAPRPLATGDAQSNSTVKVRRWSTLKTVAGWGGSFTRGAAKLLAQTLFVVLVVGLVGKFIQEEYGDTSWHHQDIIVSNKHPDPDPTKPNATCAHFLAKSTFERAPAGLSVVFGTMDLWTDVCWDGVKVWEQPTNYTPAVCEVHLPFPINYAERWCGDAQANEHPDEMTMGLDFAISPYVEQWLCQRGWIRIVINNRGELKSWNGTVHRQAYGNIARGC
jgi:hypothetical protein